MSHRRLWSVQKPFHHLHHRWADFFFTQYIFLQKCLDFFYREDDGFHFRIATLQDDVSGGKVSELTTASYETQTE